MKLNRQQLRALLAEAVEDVRGQLVTEDLDDPAREIYKSQTIVDAAVFEDPVAIMENFQKLIKAMGICWENDQRLDERIKALEEQLGQSTDT